VEADLSPSRVTATILNAAPDARYIYTQADYNSGGGRTEEKRDRINQQQIDRSRNSNWTQAGGTEITVGTTSAYGWTTFPAEKQVAAIEMRAGQNDGPLPFEASFEFGDTIINRALATAKRWIRRLRGKRKGVFCNKVHVIWKSRNNFLDQEIIFLDQEIIFLDQEIIFLCKENQGGGANNLVFQSRGISIHFKANGQRDGRATFGWINVARDQRRGRSKHQPNAALLFRAGRLAAGREQIHFKGNGQRDGRATFGWVNVARDQRRGRSKHQPNAALLFRAGRLAAGREQIRRPSMASRTAAHAATVEPKVTVMDGFEMRDEAKPAPTLLLRAARLGAGEAQVEAERDEVTLPAEELRTATTL
jgi:hypothetical protein